MTHPATGPATPQLSIQVANFAVRPLPDWHQLADHAVAADRAGVDRLAVADHVAFGDDLSAYGDPSVGGTAGGHQPTGPDGSWLEPLTTLAWLAARTDRIRLQTGILLAALRRPVVLAKMAATLDVLSEGRLDLGVGVGWQAAEYEAAGLNFAERGHLLDEALAVCQKLWTEDRASYHGSALVFSGIHAQPKPTTNGKLPIWVSGTVNRRTARRLAAFGSGWIPWGYDRNDVVNGIIRMRELLTAMGLDAGDFQVQGVLPLVKGDDSEIDISRTMEAAPQLVAAGVTDCRIAVPVPGDVDEATEALSELVDAFRSTVGREPAERSS